LHVRVNHGVADQSPFSGYGYVRASANKSRLDCASILVSTLLT